MAEVDKEFNLRDWEWIAVHFPPSERESMAKVAWLICCKCTSEEISERNIDLKIVIPLCAIVLLDKRYILELKRFAKDKGKEINNYRKVLEKSETKQEIYNRFTKIFIDPAINSIIRQENYNRIKEEFINPAINSINPSKKWLSLFETLDVYLQFSLLYSLIKYRPPTRDDWRKIFLGVRHESLGILRILCSSLVIIFIMLFSLFTFVNYVLSLESVDTSLVPFYFKWFIERVFLFVSIFLFMFMILLLISNPKGGPSGYLLPLLYRISFRFDLLKFLSIRDYYLDDLVAFSCIIAGCALGLTPICLLFYFEEKNNLLDILILSGSLLLFSLLLLPYFSWQKILLLWIIMSIICSILWIYSKNVERKNTNPLKNVFKPDGSVNIISLTSKNNS
ncbi:MAG: hypothetical protein F6K39_02880 [Okeania sp. SIO3B3]|nr:hypothetical protein [Okeania sp. SIO3B3]